jgi:hypothetical protein
VPKKQQATVKPQWSVRQIRGKGAELLGHVRATSYDEAMKQAVVEFHLPDWVAKRLLVTRNA